MYLAYNDYELIYLVQCHQDGVALEYIFKKYERLIWKYINYYDIEEKDKEDIFQESLILLYKAVNIFNERYNKTFTKYFDLIIRRHIIYLKNKAPKVVLYENPDLFKGVDFIEEYDDVFPEFQTKFEKEIYENYFLKSKTISEIANNLKMTEKQIYNAIYRVKKKLKELI